MESFNQKSKSKGLGCMPRGPGPQYRLKNLIGFDDHDPSKHREPAYTMKFRHKQKIHLVVPGPYSVDQKFTQHGPYKPPAYTMAFKHDRKQHDLKPGPGAHAPEKNPYVNHIKKAPAYTIAARHDLLRFKVGPGPTYMLPTCIGPGIPDIKAEGAYSMAFKPKSKIRHIGPGPAAYQYQLKTYKKNCPAYSMKFRHKTFDTIHSPGPQYYYPIELIKKKEPKFSFGMKHSECMTVPMTPADDI
ncbi:outer dense fiber protein 3-like [Trichogramma pretiosum]|uniref:Outer dense fiber protein 3 n=1 Tax=Trichogramma kaykai TaxID=54128 RepID=A0ABD2WLD6_9HYME|nr:outer dense fiber protein 3-like [Trichogramma pretiosum]